MRDGGYEMKRVIVVSEGSAFLTAVVGFFLALAFGGMGLAVALGIFVLYIMFKFPAKFFAYVMFGGFLWGIGALARNPPIAIGLLGVLVVVCLFDWLRRK